MLVIPVLTTDTWWLKNVDVTMDRRYCPFSVKSGTPLTEVAYSDRVSH